MPVDARPNAPVQACPGLTHIVTARDGGLCRVRLAGGELTVAQARALAQAARRFGSGIVELTNRANLQLRGIRAHQHAELGTLLREASLGPPRDGADHLRNLMLSPTASIDAHARYDVRPLAGRLLARLQDAPCLQRLSPKFAVLLDGGERLAMLAHAHDVWLAAMPGQTGETRFAFGLAGCPPVAGAAPAAAYETSGTTALGTVAPEHVPDLIEGLITAFLELGDGSHTRMRDLLRTLSEEVFLTAVQKRLGFTVDQRPAVGAWRRAGARAALRVGAHAQAQPGLCYVGAQVPLGRLDLDTWEALSELAASTAGARLRVTPWQGVLLPDVPRAAVPRVRARLDALGLLTTLKAPLARLVACAGQTGCAKGRADTKTDALRLAERLPPGVEAHVSGCARACAAGGRPMPVTLLASAPGVYDLYRWEQPTPWSRQPRAPAPPAPQPDTLWSPSFGRCVARQLTLEELANQLARSPTDA